MKDDSVRAMLVAEAAMFGQRLRTWALLATGISIPLLIISGVSHLPDAASLFFVGLLTGAFLTGTLIGLNVGVALGPKFRSLTRSLIALLNPSQSHAGRGHV